MKKNLIKSLFCLVFFVLFFFNYAPISQSTPVTNLKNQLSSAQLSYFARLGTSNTLGDSVIIINTVAGTAPSTNNYNLDIGDTLYIGLGTGSSTVYTINGLSDTNAISLGGTIGVGATANTPVIAKRYATHYVSFAPQSYDATEQWQVLIKANGSTPTDGIPDADGFDALGLGTSDITCPWNGTKGVGTTIYGGNNYILITCSSQISHTFGDGTTGVIIIGGTNQLMNPAPAANHVVGQANASADTYTFYLRELNGTTLMNSNMGKIALTESVRITATVDPTLTFIISNTGIAGTLVTSIGTNICITPVGTGATDTTAASVNFGSLVLGSFNNLAQFLSCTTNASNGYVIQTFESGRLTKIGSGSTFADTNCDGACSISIGTTWGDTSASEFGYSLQIGSTASTTGTVSVGITNPGFYKAFGLGYANAQTILSRTGVPATTDSIYVCYRISVATNQPAGTYQNEVNYIATATF